MTSVTPDRGGLTREQALRSLGRLPSLSPTAVQLLGRLAKRTYDIGELTSLVERDPLLTAQILEVANSAMFARSRHIGSLGHAIAMIGFGSMRKLALARSISNLFSRRKFPPSFSLVRFNLHSVATGTLLELMADEVPLESADSAFLAGLFHDVGKLLIAVSMPQQYEDILGLAAVTGGSLIESERQVIGMDHPELSALAIDHWGLPKEIGAAAAYHHRPDAAEPPPAGQLSLTLAVNRADGLINLLGMGIQPPSLAVRGIPPLDLPGFAVNQARLYERFAAEWKTASELFR